MIGYQEQHLFHRYYGTLESNARTEGARIRKLVSVLIVWQNWVTNVECVVVHCHISHYRTWSEASCGTMIHCCLGLGSSTICFDKTILICFVGINEDYTRLSCEWMWAFVSAADWDTCGLLNLMVIGKSPKNSSIEGSVAAYWLLGKFFMLHVFDGYFSR